MIIKKIFLSIFLIVFSHNILFAQLRLFSTYTDSLRLMYDVEVIVADFEEKVKKAFPGLQLDVKPVVYTTSNLMFFGAKDNVLVVPLWQQVNPEVKDYFTSLSGNQDEAARVFGLLFNGYYIVQKLGYALQLSLGMSDWNNIYKMEYTAHEIAISYWKSSGFSHELRACYDFTRIFIKFIPDPVPDGQDPMDFFSKNYARVELDPFVSAYFQFRQFNEIYENHELPPFEDYLKRLKPQ